MEPTARQQKLMDAMKAAAIEQGIDTEEHKFVPVPNRRDLCPCENCQNAPTDNVMHTHKGVPLVLVTFEDETDDPERLMMSEDAPELSDFAYYGDEALVAAFTEGVSLIHDGFEDAQQNPVAALMVALSAPMVSGLAKELHRRGLFGPEQKQVISDAMGEDALAAMLRDHERLDAEIDA
jgi:hypothetical protein